jgi:hypothetical protein
MSANAMAIEGKAVLVTGANQVEEAGSLDILFNNAGVALPAELSDRAALERHLAVNLFGTWGVTEAFLPLLTRTGRRRRQRRLRGRPCRRAGPSRLLDLGGGRVLALAVVASPLRGPGRERACSHGRPDRHRHCPRSRHPEDLARGGRPGHLRRGRERGGVDLPRPDVREDGGELAHGCGQGSRAPEGGAPRSRARRGMSNRTGRGDLGTGRNMPALPLRARAGLMTTKWRETDD